MGCGVLLLGERVEEQIKMERIAMDVFVSIDARGALMLAMEKPSEPTWYAALQHSTKRSYLQTMPGQPKRRAQEASTNGILSCAGKKSLLWSNPPAKYEMNCRFTACNTSDVAQAFLGRLRARYK